MRGRTSPIVGVILAGGRSRRMGGADKALLALGGRPMLARVIDRLRPQVSEIVLNANGDPGRFARFGLPVVEDAMPGHSGPLAGILAGLRWAYANRPDAPFIVTAAGDTPFFPADLVDRFLAAAGETHPRVVIARSAAGPHPVFGLWPTRLADDLQAALVAGMRKVRDWTNACAATEVFFPPLAIGATEVDPFFNVNRPDDLVEAEAMLFREPLGTG